MPARAISRAALPPSISSRRPMAPSATAFPPAGKIARRRPGDCRPKLRRICRGALRRQPGRPSAASPSSVCWSPTESRCSAAEGEPPADRKMGERPMGEQEPRDPAETMTSNSKPLAGSTFTNRSNYAGQASPPQAMRNFSGVAAGDTSGLALQAEASQRAAASSSTDADALNMFYVEATPTQIEATLAGLAAQPKQFLAVSVAPAPGIQTQDALGAIRLRQLLQRTTTVFPPRPPNAAARRWRPARPTRAPGSGKVLPQTQACRSHSTLHANRWLKARGVPARCRPTSRGSTKCSSLGRCRSPRRNPRWFIPSRGPRSRRGGAEVQGQARAGVAQQSRATETQSNTRTKSGAQPGPNGARSKLRRQPASGRESAAPQTSGGGILASPPIAVVPQAAPPAAAAVQLAEKPAEKANELSQSQSGQSASAGNGRAPGRRRRPSASWPTRWTALRRLPKRRRKRRTVHSRR